MSNIDQQKYYALKTLRGEARLAERNAEREGDACFVDLIVWGEIIQSATEILQQGGNDINIACWLIEGLVRVEGFAGFAAGFEALQKMLVTAWPDVGPDVEDEDAIVKFNALVGLDGGLNEGALIKPLRMSKLTEETSALTACALWQFQQEDQADLNTVNQLLKSNNQDFLVKQKQQLELGLTTLSTLQHWLEETFAHEAPVLGNLRIELNRALEIIDNELQRRLKAAQEEVQNNTNDGQATGSTDASSREELLAQIEAIAEIFAEREPHSPIPSVLQQAVRWGQMSLAEVMQEMLQSPGAYQEYCRSAGFEPAFYAGEPEMSMPTEINHSFT